MAKKLNTKTIIATKSMQESKEIYDNRSSSTFVDLVGAMGTFERAEKLMGGRKKDLKAQIDTLAPEQVQLELDSYKTSPDEEVVIVSSDKKYRAKAAKVVDVDIDSDAIMKFYGHVDPKYFKVSVTINKDQLVEDAVAGTLPASLAPLVSVATVEQLKISASAFKPTSTAPSSKGGAE